MPRSNAAINARIRTVIAAVNGAGLTVATVTVQKAGFLRTVFATLDIGEDSQANVGAAPAANGLTLQVREVAGATDFPATSGQVVAGRGRVFTIPFGGGITHMRDENRPYFAQGTVLEIAVQSAPAGNTAATAVVVLGFEEQ